LIFNPEIHNRRSVRLKVYDYAQPGAYFVTVCSWLRGFIFGEIINGKMEMNEYGMVLKQEWGKINNGHHDFDPDQFVVMPNHMHGIVNINRSGVLPYATGDNALRLQSQTIGSLIRRYKSTTTRQINNIRSTPCMPVLQRNYFEHIIRNDFEMDNIQEYIRNNPVRWAFDKDNPLNIQIDP
jgi:REP element-mobilizing transposase RayT